MKRLIIFVLAAVLLSAHAMASDIFERQAASLPLNDLEQTIPAESRDLMGNVSPTDEGAFFESARDIFRRAISYLGGYASEGIACCAKILMIVLACSLAQSSDRKELRAGVLLAGSAAICLCFTGDYRTMASLGAETIGSFEAFSEALLPLLCATASATGAVGSANAIYAVSVFFFHLLTKLLRVILLPLLSVYLAVAACDAALGASTLSGMKKTISGFLKGTLKTILFVFSAFLTVTGITSGSVDAVSLKAAKLGISSAVPIVGGMVSDASESVLASLALLHNSVGAFGMLSALSIGLIPFLRVGIQYALLQGTSALCAVTGASELSELVRDTASVMGFLLAATGICAIFVFLSCICYLKGFVL